MFMLILKLGVMWERKWPISYNRFSLLATLSSSYHLCPPPPLPPSVTLSPPLSHIFFSPLLSSHQNEYKENEPNVVQTKNNFENSKHKMVAQCNITKLFFNNKNICFDLWEIHMLPFIQVIPIILEKLFLL